MKCKRETCSRKARPNKNQGLCAQHYRLAPRGYVDAGPSSRHLVALNKSGFSWLQLAELVGMSEYGLCRVRDGQRVQVETQTKILSIPLRTQFEGRGRVDSIGVQRRIQALGAIGWPQGELELRLGIGRNRLSIVLLRPQIYTPLARKIAALYDELSGTPGPSSRSAAIAKGKRWAPPDLWDDDIDDPDAIHPLTGHVVLSFPEKLEEFREMGITNREHLAARMGYDDLRSFERQLDRLGLRESA